MSLMWRFASRKPHKQDIVKRTFFLRYRFASIGCISSLALALFSNNSLEIGL